MLLRVDERGDAGPLVALVCEVALPFASVSGKFEVGFAGQVVGVRIDTLTCRLGSACATMFGLAPAAVELVRRVLVHGEESLCFANVGCGDDDGGEKVLVRVAAHASAAGFSDAFPLVSLA